MCRLFNKILQSGSLPISWGRALIVPLYKTKGSVNDPSNYRGIALLSCVSKVFTKILNNRLTNCAEDNDKMYEVQGGFTKGKSTIDQIFVFQSLVSKYVTKKRGRFYRVFVDFAKAFDSVPHLHLFYSLIQEVLHGRTICLLRNMYQKLNSCIQTSSGHITESFSCSKGTRQGCMSSPLMFVFYINELIKQAEANQCRGIYVNE